MYSLMLLLLLAGTGVASESTTGCHIRDSSCLDTRMNTLYSEVVNGIPDLNIPPSDPLEIPEMIRKMPMYRYNKTNSTFRGLKRCTMSKVKLSSDLNMLNFALNCPGYGIAGTVDVQGYLMYEYAYGQGAYNISCGSCTVHVYAQLVPVEGRSVRYFQTGEFSLYVVQRQNCSFEFSGLYHGDEVRTAEAAIFATKNSMEVMGFENLEYMFSPAMDLFLAKMNVKLSAVPAGELFTSK